MGSAITDDLFGQINTSLVKVGVDEVGRGCLAGPVVACASFKLSDCQLPKVYDSKTLTALEREVIYSHLVELENFHYSFGVVSSETIDQINILQATFKAMRLAISRLPQEFDEILVDGSLIIPGISKAQRAVIKGDAKEPLISASSILAKVFRDKLMDTYAKMYPEYGFDLHKGYGTAFHLEMIKKHGPCPIHRKTFAPLVKKESDNSLLLPFEDFFI